MSSDVIVALIAAAGAVVVTWMQTRLHKQVRATRHSTAAVLHEVRNAHGTNLRDDLDIVLDGIDGLRKDVGGLRSEIRQEREERGNADKAERDERVRLADQLREHLREGHRP